MSSIAIYLDQSRWVHLAQAREGNPRAPEGATRALHTLTRAVADSRIVVPLSAAHYQETWNEYDWRSRYALAGLMRDLSRWQTLAPLQRVTRLEIEASLSANQTIPNVLGVGANHAFDSPNGRFIPVKRWPAGLYPVSDVADGDNGLEILRTSPEIWEWGNLAGPPDDFPLEGFAEGDGLDFRPEHARGDDWVEWQLEIRQRAEQAGLRHRLHDVLITESLAAMLDELNAVAMTIGVDLHRLFDPPIVGPRKFHDSLPARSTYVALSYHALNESQYVPKQHDRSDLVAHAVALAYCDVVVTENRVADLARKARVADRFGTTVLHKLADLTPLLEAA